MKAFKQFVIEEKLLTEGGNSPFINRETGQVLGRAERMNMSSVNRKEIQRQLLTLLKELNVKFGKMYDRPLWPSWSIVASGEAFNGSSEQFFDSSISDADFKKYKKTVGDMDLTIPHGNLKPLFDLLATLENKKLAGGTFIYKGQNKKKQHGHQINSIFQLQNPKINLQIDFEGVNYEKDRPDEFAKFSHSSNWEDMKAGLKGLGHKLLLMNMARALSEMHNVVVLTPSSTAENPKVSAAETEQFPTNLAFSVDSGARFKYEPVMKGEQQLVIDDKKAYKKLPTTKSKYTTNLKEIFYMMFSKKPSETDMIKFRSFVGILSLLEEKKIKKQVIIAIFENILTKSMFCKHCQGTEVNNPDGDRNTKMIILNQMVSKFSYLKPILDKAQPMIEKYYQNYKEVKVDS